MVDRSHLRGSKPRRMRPKIFLLHETQLLKVHVARVGTSVSGQLVPGYTEGGVERCREHADIRNRGAVSKGRIKKRDGNETPEFTSTLVSNCLWTPSCCLETHRVGIVREGGLRLRIKVPFARRR